ncbi:MAG TPA: GAF domain-containing protein [Gaiellaceae bacterium]|jgi:GAF domain-containing protein
MNEDLRAAVAAGVLPADDAFRELLQSIVDVARAIFGARASSIFLLDETTDELVFEAVSGEGAEDLIGRRFSSSTGVAGWVLASRQPLVLEDVQQDARFAREAAESTGYVPDGLMAVPLLHDERVLGVLEVLDRPQRTRFTLVEMELLGLFATQAAIALDLLSRSRRAKAALEGREGAVARLAAELERVEDRQAADRLLTALADVLRV